MANLDDHDPPGEDGDRNGTPEQPSRDSLERRIRELERENAALRLDLEALRGHHVRDRQILDALMIRGLPVDRVELDEALANSQSIDDLIRELEREAPGSPG